MAAEVPVKDVLCEAMEYLSKLGSNLRTRTENLKEKKIKKDKLNNALALQKAASKVLLICELSKKSLENVETGVRKVLERVDTSQAAISDVGGNSSRTDKKRSHSEKPHYYSFEYKSRKLRIKKRVNVKHYTSVKVFARKMPASMLEKYPVYHDCKLFRIRKKRDLRLKLSDSPDRDKSNNKHHDASSSEDRTQVMSENKEKTDTDQSERQSCKSHSRDRTKSRSTSKLIEDSPIKSSKPTEHRSSVKSVDEKSNKQVHKLKENDSSDDSDRIRKSKALSLKKSNRPSVDSVNEKSNKQVDNCKENDRLDVSNKEQISKTFKKKEIKKKRIVIESSEDEEIINEDKLKPVSDDDNSLSIDKEKTLKENDKDIEKYVESDDHNVEVTEDQHKQLDDSNNSVQEPDPKKRKMNPNDEQLQNNKNNAVVTLDSSDENHASLGKFTEPEEDDNDQKPMIKLVSLSKLLKPDALKKCELLDNETKDKDCKKTEVGERSFQMRKKRMEKEDKYLIEKRKEVKAFKPKKFTINIIRLPTLNKNYLEEQQLKRVKHNGKTICEIDNENQSDESANKDQPVTLNNELVTETNRVKSSLLNESESDSQINEEATKVKNALLKDSDSDSFGNKDSGSANENDNTALENKKAKDLLFKNSDSDSNHKKTSNENKQAKLKIMGSDSDNRENEPENSVKNKKTNNDDEESKSNDVESNRKTDQEGKGDENLDLRFSSDQNDNDKVNTNQSPLNQSEEKDAKESLLNNSSDDKTGTPLKQRRETKSVTPQSKKKHIRESVHAKKMLLTYSSSSDTDDEQLRGVIKEIKDSLLKDISDDETKKCESPKKVNSDSDEEDVIKKIKKQNDNSDSESKKKERQQWKKAKRSKDGGSSSDDCFSSRRKMVRSKSKPGNCSSSQNSDARDSNEKEIDGLTNLKTLNKVRRRNSDDSDETQESRTSPVKIEKIERSGLIDGEILQAESDSDATNEDNDAVEDVDEDLPPVTMSFNGVSMDHLVKEDLLGESDSSMSNNENEKNSETNKEESEEEEKVNSKRRKANAISSDSEVGSSRKKDKDVRLSDFEDTEDENSEPGKKSKRKKKGSDSDASQGSNDAGKKKRRRIKSMDSDVSGSESDNEGRNKHGRKNIRKVMGKNQLEEATKRAAREEKERIARIAERQKLYNNLEFDESGKPDEVVLEKVVLDFDPETKEPLIEVDRGLVKKLKPHQANGIKFMWNACFESVKRIKKDKGSGCILAHCMGLGKTLQVVSLTHTLLTHGDLTGVNRVLVVCPLSTVLNWVNEFRMWLKHAESDYDLDVYELSRFKQNSERAFQLSQWLEHGGVCVLGYEMFRNLSADNSKKFKKKMLKNFQEALVDPGPDLVVCDEGHLLKNEKTSLSQSMNRVKTLRRIVLTGTPLQNNLKEYYCMVQFVKPNLLGKYNEYLNRFVNPITNGQYTDSTEHDIKVMKRRSHVLHKMLDGAVQRRDYGVLAPFLPPKHEYVLFITLNEIQVKLYQYYLDNYSRRPLAGKSSGFLFPDFQSLQRIWTHPLVLKYNSERYEIMQQKKREREEEDSEGSLVDFIDDDSTPDETSTDESSDDLSDLSDDSRKKSKKKKSAKKSKGKDSKAGPRRGTRANPIDQEDDGDNQDDVVEVKNDNPTEWWIKMVTDDEIEDMRNSHKLVLLFDILRQCETIGDKLLVFSQSLYSLDLIEHFLGKVDEATQEGRIDEKLGGHVGSWSPGIDYFRLDGSTSCENRSIWCKNFNREDNPRARLFLISTRAGGLGINLVAANRVVIFDVSWNPSHDVQSIFRVYRFGQKKPCYVYRFLAMGTMEEKIYERQVTKQAISKRVIDEQQIDRHYAENDLAELYKFEPTPPSPRPLPPLPKDRLFAEMLKEHEAQIYKYHEHDSLLENKEEETLSEEERKAAWEDFENEKNRPPPAPFPSPWPMHNGMVPSLLAQQQQQLAYAALAAMLRKDMPNINDNQIRDMIPIIYNSNPGLMQKMTEIYKYAPGMLNPMMAGNVMNSASGAGAMSGMGGTSGLQYEPPWQRQQQLRLQQIMQQQQQNQMGAKLYAGGLGSRDPVAMALQQARAREIMLGGAGAPGGGGTGAGRPRGRPPMQPRAPPSSTEPGDVVNLDSD